MNVTDNIIIAVKTLLLCLSVILLIVSLHIYRILPQLRKLLVSCTKNQLHSININKHYLIYFIKDISTVNVIVCGIVMAFMKLNLLFEPKNSRAYNIYVFILSFFTIAFFMWIKCVMLAVCKTIMLVKFTLFNRTFANT